MFLYLHSSRADLWLGLQSATTSPAWADGTTAAYTNWQDGELTGDRCAAMRADTGKWISYNCDKYKGFYICVSYRAPYFRKYHA